MTEMDWNSSCVDYAVMWYSWQLLVLTQLTAYNVHWCDYFRYCCYCLHYCCSCYCCE